jgi:hypothetical protein
MANIPGQRFIKKLKIARFTGDGVGYQSIHFYYFEKLAQLLRRKSE